MPQKSLTALGALGLALALSACVGDQPPGETTQPQATVTVTETATAPVPTGEPTDGGDGSTEQAEPSADASEGPEGSDDPEDAEQTGRPGGTGPAENPVGADGLTARGNITKEIGEPASLTASSGGKALEFSVTGIEPDAQCTTAYAEPAENGTFVRVDIEATTGSAADLEELFYTDSMMFNPYDWKFVDTSGRTANGIDTVAAYTCVETRESLPADIGPGENVAGSLVFDVPEGSGTLIYEPLYDEAGWEWAL